MEASVLLGVAAVAATENCNCNCNCNCDRPSVDEVSSDDGDDGDSNDDDDTTTTTTTTIWFHVSSFGDTKSSAAVSTTAKQLQRKGALSVKIAVDLCCNPDIGSSPELLRSRPRKRPSLEAPIRRVETRVGVERRGEEETPGGDMNRAGTLVARSNFEESLRSAPPPTRYLDVDTALDIYRSRFYDQIFKARLLENEEERDSLQGSPSEFGRDVKVPVEYRSDRLGIPLTGGCEKECRSLSSFSVVRVGCKVGGVVSIRDKDEIGAFLSTQVIRPPYDLAPLAYLFDELFFSVPRMRISLQCPSLELSTMDFQ
uniref:Uncharacterized protein n=1 Tax=Vespula pensylvanica TaxID=30213 RepID=A0A834P144_VESPE|nr:hypothetical protein H0235_009061 [Vespula pensylvanica]